MIWGATDGTVVLIIAGVVVVEAVVEISTMSVHDPECCCNVLGPEPHWKALMLKSCQKRHQGRWSENGKCCCKCLQYMHG